jgi:hypothetical protein
VFSPGGERLAVGYWGVAVDILDGTTLESVRRHRPANANADFFGSNHVAWSRDGQTLFADGAVKDAKGDGSYSRGIRAGWATNAG